MRGERLANGTKRHVPFAEGRTVTLVWSSDGWSFAGLASWITTDDGQVPTFATVDEAVAWLLEW